MLLAGRSRWCLTSGTQNIQLPFESAVHLNILFTSRNIHIARDSLCFAQDIFYQIVFDIICGCRTRAIQTQTHPVRNVLMTFCRRIFFLAVCYLRLRFTPENVIFFSWRYCGRSKSELVEVNVCEIVALKFIRFFPFSSCIAVICVICGFADFFLPPFFRRNCVQTRARPNNFQLPIIEHEYSEYLQFCNGTLASPHSNTPLCIAPESLSNAPIVIEVHSLRGNSIWRRSN